ncbi:MAG TPA: hypothetical protein VK451_06115 [Methyloceanibacter sp.]|nr:hypothetical protein [Methyloceanibacter sp.]
MRAPVELAAIALLLLVAVPHAALAKTQSVVAYVLSLYDPDALGGTARYTPRTQHLWDECFRIAKKNGDACMDFSMIVMGNDFDLSDVTAVLIKGGDRSAVVDARFKNFGKITFVTYELVRDRNGWMIDEMRSGCYLLTEALQQKAKC